MKFELFLRSFAIVVSEISVIRDIIAWIRYLTSWFCYKYSSTRRLSLTYENNTTLIRWGSAWDQRLTLNVSGVFF